MAKQPNSGEIPTVFLVDDDPAIRASLSLSLKTAGFAVESYADARTFLAAYDPARRGCLVLDVRMPGLSGLELQAILAERGFSIPVIFISGHSDRRVTEQALAAGAVDVLEKPFRRMVLIERVKQALAHDLEAPRQRRP
jgi:two-component system, LuxR family, response regulator FixJ